MEVFGELRIFGCYATVHPKERKIQTMKTNYLTFLTLILSMFSCNKEQNQKYTEDFFVKIQPEKISNTDYKTTVETNFPENTPFKIGRAHV